MIHSSDQGSLLNPGAPTRILAVDDDADMGFYIQEVLEQQNCVVTPTECGLDALRLLSSQSFDLVMVDFRLPDLDGIRVMEEVRRSGCDIPFVFITGYPDQRPLIASLRLGAADFLTKPFAASELENAVRLALEKKKQQQWSDQLARITAASQIPLQEKLQSILALTASILGFPMGFVLRFTADEPTWVLLPAASESDASQAANAAGLLDKLAPVISGGVPYIHDQPDDKGQPSAFPFAAIPLRLHQTIQGAIGFYSSADASPPLQRQLHEQAWLQLTEMSISRLIEANDFALIAANQQNLMQTAQKLSSVATLATSIVHEIENHLTLIGGRTMIVKKLLQRHNRSSLAKISATLDSIGSDVSRIDRIIRSVRTMANDGNGADPRQQLQVKQLVDEALELFRCKIKSRPIRLVLAPIPPSLAIRGDATQLLQVLLILLNNSFDAIEGLAEEWIQVDMQLSGPWLRIRVTDSGRGIPKHLHEQIFRAFYTTKRAGQGLGIGLNLARRYVEAHRGKLWIDAASEHTCFVVELPAGAS